MVCTPKVTMTMRELDRLKESVRDRAFRIIRAQYADFVLTLLAEQNRRGYTAYLIIPSARCRSLIRSIWSW